MKCTPGENSKFLVKLNLQISEHSELHNRIPLGIASPQFTVRATPCPEAYREGLLSHCFIWKATHRQSSHLQWQLNYFYLSKLHMAPISSTGSPLLTSIESINFSRSIFCHFCRYWHCISASRLGPSPCAITSVITGGTGLACCPQAMPSTYMWGDLAMGSIGRIPPCWCCPCVLSAWQWTSAGTQHARGSWTIEELCSPPIWEILLWQPLSTSSHSATLLLTSFCPCLPGCTVCSSGGPCWFPNTPWHPSVTGFVLKGKENNVHRTQTVACNKHYCSSPSPEATECRHSPCASSKPETGRDAV